jgi:hypothetical protein
MDGGAAVRRSAFVALAVVGAAVLVAYWMRYTRLGAGFANDSVNPFLVRRGLSGSGPSELATLEHVGRRSGIRRLTPLHPILTDDGIRFAVPLGDRSEWARNVLAAGGCRIQLHDRVIALEEPQLVAPTEVAGMNPIIGRLTGWLGWKYLVLRRAGEAPGRLEPT